ncbi:hypothetical protein [Polymorphobacter sp.]|uniref:hypothetical protein n=1 Tax=Polymorphobacter sp. TaxID=1909290 RepID=UPI003F6FE2F2
MRMMTVAAVAALFAAPVLAQQSSVGQPGTGTPNPTNQGARSADTETAADRADSRTEKKADKKARKRAGEAASNSGVTPGAMGSTPVGDEQAN